MIFLHYFEWFMFGFSFMHLNVPQQWKRIIWSTETCRIADKVAKWFSSNRWLWTICSSESPTSANVTSFLCLLHLSHQLDITCLNIQLKSLICFLIWNRNSETVVHLLKCALGSGIFAMPNAFKHSGYVVGFFGTIFLGSIATYCVHMLVNLHYELCKWKKVMLTFRFAVFTKLNALMIYSNFRCQAWHIR